MLAAIATFAPSLILLGSNPSSFTLILVGVGTVLGLRAVGQTRRVSQVRPPEPVRLQAAADDTAAHPRPAT